MRDIPFQLHLDVAHGVHRHAIASQRFLDPRHEFVQRSLEDAVLVERPLAEAGPHQIPIAAVDPARVEHDPVPDRLLVEQRLRFCLGRHANPPKLLLGAVPWRRFRAFYAARPARVPIHSFRNPRVSSTHA